MGEILVFGNFSQVQTTSRAETTKAAKAPDTKLETRQLSRGCKTDFEHSTFYNEGMIDYIDLQPNPTLFRWHEQASEVSSLWLRRFWHC